MSPKEERKQDAETKGGHIYELINGKYVVDKKDEKDYVFISYSSADWKEVLYEIVYKTCKKYGLRVYFDTKFDVGSDSWLTQFQDNMHDSHCKAVLAFVSPNYKSSYATLMELMASQESSSKKTPVIPIVIGNSEVTSYDNTGLGTQRFSDNSTNDLWPKELELFNRLFNDIVYDPQNPVITNIEQATKVLYKNSDCSSIPYKEELKYDALKENHRYWEDHHIDYNDEDAKRRHWDSLDVTIKEKMGTPYLNKYNNARLITIILGNIDKNNIDGVNIDIPEAIKNKLQHSLMVGGVFDTDLIDYNQETNGNPSALTASPATTDHSISQNQKTNKILGPVSLSGVSKISGSQKARKMSLKELIENGILHIGDEVYVKGHDAVLGKITETGDILYNGSVFSLNRFVPEILGPGSRNAYDYVYHKPSGELLSTLRTKYQESITKESVAVDTTPLNVAPKPIMVDTEKKDDAMTVVPPTNDVHPKSTKEKKASLKEMLSNNTIHVGDEVYVKGHAAEVGKINENGDIIYSGNTFSLNKFVLEILGPGSRNAYMYVYHTLTGKTLDELR